jgi:hypothetical protein
MFRHLVEHQRIRLSRLRKILPRPGTKITGILSRAGGGTSRIRQHGDKEGLRAARGLRGPIQVAGRHQVRCGSKNEQDRGRATGQGAKSLMGSLKSRVHTRLRGHEQHQSKRLLQRSHTSTFPRRPTTKLLHARRSIKSTPNRTALQHPSPQDLEPTRLQDTRFSPRAAPRSRPPLLQTVQPNRPSRPCRLHILVPQ